MVEWKNDVEKKREKITMNKRENFHYTCGKKYNKKKVWEKYLQNINIIYTYISLPYRPFHRAVTAWQIFRIGKSDRECAAREGWLPVGAAR